MALYSFPINGILLFAIAILLGYIYMPYTTQNVYHLLTFWVLATNPLITLKIVFLVSRESTEIDTCTGSPGAMKLQHMHLFSFHIGERLFQVRDQKGASCVLGVCCEYIWGYFQLKTSEKIQAFSRNHFANILAKLVFQLGHSALKSFTHFLCSTIMGVAK